MLHVPQVNLPGWERPTVATPLRIWATADNGMYM